MNIKKEITEIEKRKICKQAFKMGYFNWLCVKTSNHLHTELSLGYPKDTKLNVKLHLLT